MVSKRQPLQLSINEKSTVIIKIISPCILYYPAEQGNLKNRTKENSFESKLLFIIGYAMLNRVLIIAWHLANATTEYVINFIIRFSFVFCLAKQQ